METLLWKPQLIRIPTLELCKMSLHSPADCISGSKLIMSRPTFETARSFCQGILNLTETCHGMINGLIKADFLKAECQNSVFISWRSDLVHEMCFAVWRRNSRQSAGHADRALCRNNGPRARLVAMELHYDQGQLPSQILYWLLRKYNNMHNKTGPIGLYY